MVTRPRYDQVIVVGSTVRKAGKTTYITNLLKKNPGVFVAIKIQTSSKYKNFEIFKENINGLENDTQKYLNSGARDAYLINAPVERVMEAFITVYEKINKDDMVLCESTSLVKYIGPKKFILFHKTDSDKLKPDVDQLIALADEIITVD
jgi:hypothetical protein